MNAAEAIKELEEQRLSEEQEIEILIALITSERRRQRLCESCGCVLTEDGFTCGVCERNMR